MATGGSSRCHWHCQQNGCRHGTSESIVLPTSISEGCSDLPCFLPIGSKYGIFTYIWLIFLGNVGKYTIHGSYGLWKHLLRHIYKRHFTSFINFPNSSHDFGCFRQSPFMDGLLGARLYLSCRRWREMWKKNSRLVVRLGRTSVGVRSLAHVPKEGCRWVLLGDKINMFRQQNLKNALSSGIKDFVSLTCIPKFSSLLFYMTKKHTKIKDAWNQLWPPCTHLQPWTGPSNEAEVTEGKDEGILPVDGQTTGPPGGGGAGESGKIEGNEALPPAMPRKERGNKTPSVWGGNTPYDT